MWTTASHRGSQSEPLFTGALQIDKGGQPTSQLYCLSFARGLVVTRQISNLASIVIDLHDITLYIVYAMSSCQRDLILDTLYQRLSP
jgi:hypothetical protein